MYYESQIPTSDTLLIEHWLQGYSRHTARNYKNDLLRFFSSVRVPTSAVTTHHLHTFRHSLTSLALPSQVRILTSIKSWLRFCHEKGYLHEDLASALSVPSLPSHVRTSVLTANEARAIIRSELLPRNQLLIEVLYAGALTVTEITTLQCRDLHVGENHLHLALHGPHPRTVTFRLLRQSLVRLRDLVKTRDESSPVFLSQKGASLSQPQIHRILHAAAVRVGLERPLSPAMFRHAAASHLLEQGVTLQELQHLLGHRSPATTSRFLFTTTQV